MLLPIVFILVFAAIFLSVGIIINSADKKRKKICTQEVSATVIENKKVSTKNNGHRSTTYKPVFRYEYKQKEYIAESSYSTNPPVFSEGESLEIFIDPSSPQKIYVPQMKTGLILSVIFTAAGGIAVAAAVIVFIAMYK